MTEEMVYGRDFTISQSKLCQGTRKKRRGLRGSRGPGRKLK